MVSHNYISTFANFKTRVYPFWEGLTDEENNQSARRRCKPNAGRNGESTS
jgi:hypothetical protein